MCTSVPLRICVLNTQPCTKYTQQWWEPYISAMESFSKMIFPMPLWSEYSRRMIIPVFCSTREDLVMFMCYCSILIHRIELRPLTFFVHPYFGLTKTSFMIQLYLTIGSLKQCYVLHVRTDSTASPSYGMGSVDWWSNLLWSWEDILLVKEI